MRYPAEHKDRMRKKIVRAAARRFSGAGSEGVPIADLMRDLDLTHGGFYRHFQGKEELFDEALAESMAQVEALMTATANAAPRGKELEAIIDLYLSPAHCANVAEGCPLAALVTEVARHPKSTRVTLSNAVKRHAAAVARFMPGETEAERQGTAMVLFSGMAGALNLARAVSDDALRRKILARARDFYAGAVRGKP